MNKQSLKDLINKDHLEEAINALLEITKNDPHLSDQVSLISGSYQSLKGQIRTGQLTYQEQSEKKAKIGGSLLSILKDLPDEDYEVTTSPPPKPSTPVRAITTQQSPYLRITLMAVAVLAAGLLIWWMMQVPPVSNEPNGGEADNNSEIILDPTPPKSNPVVVEPISPIFYGQWKNKNPNATTMIELNISKDDNNMVWVELISFSKRLGKYLATVQNKEHLVLPTFDYPPYATYTDANIHLNANGSLEMRFNATLHDQDNRVVSVTDNFSK